MAETPRSAEHTSSLKIYFRLLSYVKPYVGIFLLSIIGFVIFASTQPMLAGILKYFVDGLSNPEAVLFPNVPYLRDLQLLQAVPLLIILIAAWQGLGSFLGNYFLAKVSLCLVHDLRVELFNKLLVLPNRYFDNHNSGHLISRITFNVTMVTGAATDAIKVVIREGLTVVFLFGYLLWMNWHLTLVMVAILPVIAVMVSVASKKFRKQSKKIQVAMGDVTHVASETIQGYRVVRSFGGEAYEQQRFGKASQSNTDKQLHMTKTGSLYTPMLQLVIYSAMAALMFLVLFLRGDSTAGDLVAYITAAGLLPKPIRQLSEVSSTIQKGLAGAESIFEQLDEAPEVDSGTVEKERVEGRLEVRNLSFTYPGTEREVLSDISFGAGQALLDGGADFRKLTNRLGQQTGGSNVSHQVTGSGITAQEQHQEHQRGHGAVDHQLQHRRVQRAGLGHLQLLVGVALAGLAEPLLLIGLAAEAAHHAVALDGFRGDVGDVTHGHLDLLALLAEFLAGDADHYRDHRKDGNHHQGQVPVHPQQVAEQEHHGQAFADHHLDRIGGRTGDHGHVEGDARDQVPGVVVVEVAVRQHQQLVEQFHTQVVHQAQGNLGQEVVAEERAQALPRSDQDDQQRYRLQQLQVAQVGDVGEQHRFRVAQPIDEILQDPGQHRLGRGKNHETDDAQQENADIGFHIAQQPEVDLQAGGVLRRSRCFGHYQARCSG